MIPSLVSRRLADVHRSFEAYTDRRAIIRLDRNEDPDGWDLPHFTEWLGSLEPYDIAAYGDSTELVASLSNWTKLASNQILVTAGSDSAIKQIFETYLDEGDSVVALDPSWRMYAVYASAYRAQLVPVAHNNEFSHSLEQLCHQIRETRPKLVVLANPNQPTGAQFSESALQQILESLAGSHTILVVDEAYHMFSEVSGVGLISQSDRTIVVRTFSKAFGLAGLRVGYCLASQPRIADLQLLRPVTDSNSIALKAATYSLRHLDWVEKRVSSIIEGREFLYQALVNCGARTFPSATNFVLVACSSREEAGSLVQKCRARGFAIKGPLDFGNNFHFVRVSCGSVEVMHQFWHSCGDLFGHREL